MSNAQDLTKDTFDSTIAQGVTLVDFWATWCQPCLMMAPILDGLAEKYSDKITVGKVNVDNEQELAQKFQVSAIPTLLLLKDGELQNRFVGITSEADLTNAIEAVCS